MAKRKGSFRNSFSFLIGVFIYSILFWVSDRNYTQVFGSLLLGLGCYIIYALKNSSHLETDWIKPKDIMNICGGIVFDAFLKGFPFSNG